MGDTTLKVGDKRSGLLIALLESAIALEVISKSHGSEYVQSCIYGNIWREHGTTERAPRDKLDSSAGWKKMNIQCLDLFLDVFGCLDSLLDLRLIREIDLT